MWLGVSRGAERTEYKEEERIITKLDNPALDTGVLSIEGGMQRVYCGHICAVFP